MVRSRFKPDFKFFVIIFIAIFIFFAADTSSWACDVLVVSGRVTTNGRPLIWKNRDISSNWRAQMKYFEEEYSEVGGYVVVCNYDDVANFNNGTYINPGGGVNDAGFAIACTSVYEDFNPPHEMININTDLMRETLQKCTTLDDFEELLRNWHENHPLKVISGNFVAIDAHGGAALYECWTGINIFLYGNEIKFMKFDANNGRITRYGGNELGVFVPVEEVIDEGDGDDFIGFFNRANNHTYVPINYGDERMYRATEICTNLIDEGRMNFRNVLREVSKDVVGDQSYHSESSEESYSTTYCISRNQTRIGLVVDGVKSGDDPALTTFWCALGEPSIAVFAPYFSYAAGVNYLSYIDGIGIDGTLYDLNDTCMLNREANRREAYDNLVYKKNTGNAMTGMDTRLINKVELAKVQEWTFPLEDYVLDMTGDYLADMRSDSELITIENLREFSDYSVLFLYENYSRASVDYFPWTFEKPW